MLLLCWFIISFGMTAPPQWQDLSYRVTLSNDQQARALAQALAAVDGVEEVRVVQSEQTAYLKVHKSHYNEEHIATQLESFQTQA